MFEQKAVFKQKTVNLCETEWFEIKLNHLTVFKKLAQACFKMLITTCV